MANVTLYAGVALILFGVVSFTGALPLSVLASNVSVDCSGGSSCTATATVSNSGGWGTSPFSVWFVYKNSDSQTVLIDKQSSSIASGSSATVTDTFAGSSCLGCSSVTVFAIDANGYPSPGPSAGATFGSLMKFTIFYGSVGSLTVSPPGMDVQNCVSQCGPANIANYQAVWAAGTLLTVTTSGGVAPVGWSNGGSGSDTPCTASGSGFVCNMTVPQSGGIAFIETTTSLSQTIISVAVGGGGGITPQSICLSQTAYTSATYGTCGPTGSFSISPPAQWNIQPVGGGSTIQSGFGSTASLSYANLSSKVSFQSGVASLMIVVSLPVILTIQQPTVSGVTITPAPATYTCSPSSAVCKPGGTVQLSVTVPSGYQLNGWIVNGQNVGTANPYTLSIPQTGSTAVAAAVVSCSSSGCPPPPPPPGPPVGPSQVIGVASLMGGAALVFLGLRKKR